MYLNCFIVLPASIYIPKLLIKMVRTRANGVFHRWYTPT